MTRLLFTLGTAGLAALGFAFSFGDKPQARVSCCGECKSGDNCLEMCEAIGEVPKGLKLTCCGKCQKGDNCLEKCAGGTCCVK